MGIRMMRSGMTVGFLLASTALVLPGLALAQDFDLGDIVVSGGLSPIEAASYGRAYSVVTAEQIEERGLTSVQDALRSLPGVSINGPGASAAQVRIRGSESNHVLILIDGVEARGGDDEFQLSGLSTANIERIEVLRGPQSVFYGSNASSGVINIITRKGTEGTQYGGAVEYGNGISGSAYVSTRTERGGLSFDLSTRDDKGYDHSGTPGGDADGIDRKTLSLAGDYMLTDTLKLGFTVRKSNERYEYDGNSFTATNADEYVIDTADYGDRDELTLSIYGELDTLDGRLTHRLSYQDSQYDTNNNGGPTVKGKTEALKYRAVYGLDGAVADAAHTLSFIVDRQEDSNTGAANNKRDMTSYGVEYRGGFDNGLDLQAGLRYDDNSVFKSATSYTLGVSYAVPNSGVRLHASAGAGTVNPNYFELYGGFGTIGNTDLQPEENQSFDIGVETSFMDGRGSVDVTYFNERLKNEITYSFTPLADGTNYFNQTGTSPRQGLEVAGRFAATDNLSLGVAYTYLDAKNPDKSVEVRRPQHELGLNAQLKTFGGRGTVAADLRYVAGNYDTQYWGSFATVKTPEFVTVNLAANYDLTDTVTLTGRVTNLFDKDYVETWGYATQGRTAYVGLEAKW